MIKEFKISKSLREYSETPDAQLPLALRRYLDHQVGRNPATRLPRHVSLAARLRRRWESLMTFVPTDDQLCDAAEWLVSALAHGRKLLGFGFVLMLLYLIVEIGSAFLPGGAVHRVLGGGQ